MFKGKNYIAGEWLLTEERVTNINPSDITDKIGEYSQANVEQVGVAVQSAKEAQKIWAKTGVEKRYTILMNIGNELINRCEELGRLLSREEGKPFLEGKGEVYRAGQFFTYYAAECLRQIGENTPSSREGIDVDIRREPIGVVAVISPWNFPMATASWKIAPALCYGNSVIWKPANLTLASAVALTEIIARQDIPRGLFNLIMGPGHKIGHQLSSHKAVDGVSFTGSVDVGRKIAQNAVGNFTKIQLEMGSKNALVVLDDAHMNTALQCAINSAFGGTGQKCTAASRLVIHRNIYDQFLEKFQTATQALKVGHALEEGTQMGPVVSAMQLQENLENVQRAQDEGGKLIWGGSVLERLTQGYYMEPTIIANTKPDWRINQEELFAPMTNLIKVSDYEEALQVAKDTRFGLTSSIITQSLAKAHHFKQNMPTGCVMINLPTAGTDYHVPFGGRGESSYGSREQGRYAQEFYTHVKTSYFNYGEI